MDFLPVAVLTFIVVHIFYRYLPDLSYSKREAEQQH